MLGIMKVAFMNLILSTDNVLIIALFSKGLPKGRKFFVLGLSLVASAVLQLGILYVVAVLFRISFLKFLFGLLICYLAVKLLEKRDEKRQVIQKNSMWYATGKIVIGNLLMSFENEATLITLTNGHVWVAWLGILITSPFIFFGSHMITLLLERFAFILYIGSILLFHIGLGLVFTLPMLQSYTKVGNWLLTVAFTVAVGIVYVMRSGLVRRSRSKSRHGST